MLERIKNITILFIIFIGYLNAKVVIEDGKGVDRWKVVVGEEGDIKSVFDDELNSTVIEFLGGGSYKLGATQKDKALNIKNEKFISWQMSVEIPYTIYIIANTKFGLRYIFYVSTHSRGLKHGLENGIHHGLGENTISGRWIRVTRDLQRDIKDAEPENSLIAINGFIFNGGNGARLDNLIAYTPKEITYLSEPKKISYLDINNSKFKIFQWSFKGFGNARIIDTRGVVEDPKAFEFIIGVDTKKGKRELLYTLGTTNLGLIDNKTIHHALGDDRTIGAVWVEDYPRNKLGLWQGVTRDLNEDIKDFEIDNSLVKVLYFKVKGDGKVRDVKMFSSPDDDINATEMNSTQTEDSNSTCKSSQSGIAIDKTTIYMIVALYIILLIHNREDLVWEK